jgi:hypothetical protein
MEGSLRRQNLSLMGPIVVLTHDDLDLQKIQRLALLRIMARLVAQQCEFCAQHEIKKLV